MVNAPYQRVSNAQIAANRRVRFLQLEALRTGVAVNNNMIAAQLSGRAGKMNRMRSRPKPKQQKKMTTGSPFDPAEGLDFGSLF